MARDIVRMQSQITKFYKMRAQMQSVALQMQVCPHRAFHYHFNLCLVREITTSHGQGNV